MAAQQYGWRHLVYLGVACAALVNGGCLAVAAGIAGGAALGTAYYYGKIHQTFPSSLDDSLLATKAALADLAMPVLEDTREPARGFLRSTTADGDPVRIYLDPDSSKFLADGPMTRITVRVATFGDHPVSNRVLDQISAHLAPAGAVVGPPPVSTVPPPATGAVTPAAWSGLPAPVAPAVKAPVTTVEPPLANGLKSVPPSTAPPAERAEKPPY